MEILRQYHQLSFWLQVQCGGDKILHVHLGLALWCLSGLLTGRSLRSRIHLLTVFVPEIANETIDYVTAVDWSLIDTLADIVATMAWPVALWLMLNHKRKKRNLLLANGRTAPASVKAAPVIEERSRPVLAKARPMARASAPVDETIHSVDQIIRRVKVKVPAAKAETAAEAKVKSSATDNKAGPRARQANADDPAQLSPVGQTELPL